MSESGVGGVEGQAGDCIPAANLVEERSRVGDSFGVDGDYVGAGRDELLGVLGRIGDHQMGVQRQGRGPAEGFDDRHAVGHIGYELTVHHIEMESPSPGGFESGYFLGEPAEVAQEHRRQDDRRVGAERIENR
jgi:hypothetical protein